MIGVKSQYIADSSLYIQCIYSEKKKVISVFKPFEKNTDIIGLVPTWLYVASIYMKTLSHVFIEISWLVFNSP